MLIYKTNYLLYHTYFTKIKIGPTTLQFFTSQIAKLLLSLASLVSFNCSQLEHIYILTSGWEDCAHSDVFLSFRFSFLCSRMHKTRRVGVCYSNVHTQQKIAFIYQETTCSVLNSESNWIWHNQYCKNRKILNCICKPLSERGKWNAPLRFAFARHKSAWGRARLLFYLDIKMNYTIIMLYAHYQPSHNIYDFDLNQFILLRYILQEFNILARL